MGPVAQSDRHDLPGLVDELVPGLAAVAEDVVVGCEDPVRQPVFAHELPDVLDGVELGRLGGQRHHGGVVGHLECLGDVPSGLVEHEDRVRAGCHHGGDLGEVQAHRLRAAARQHEACALALRRTDGSEDVGRGGALVVGGRRPGPAPRPPPSDLVLLADARLVLEPDLYRLAAGPGLDTRHDFGEVFLKAAAAASLFS